MPEFDPRVHATHPESPDSGLLRRLLLAAGLVLVALILLAVAIYAGAFIMLAPMMQ
ncbi:hypothetical protein [Mycobacterium sp. URHB0021]|jgi:hypothetical protein